MNLPLNAFILSAARSFRCEDGETSSILNSGPLESIAISGEP
jgi:hypothetical protein